MIIANSLLSCFAIGTSPANRSVGANTPPIRRATPKVSYTIDRGGEMPPDAIKAPSPAPAGSSSQAKTVSATPSPIPTPFRNPTPTLGQAPTPPPAFVPYELEDEAALRPSTPELIKVTKAKKASGTGKKKKARDKGAGTDSANASNTGHSEIL